MSGSWLNVSTPLIMSMIKVINDVMITRNYIISTLITISVTYFNTDTRNNGQKYPILITNPVVESVHFH